MGQFQLATGDRRGDGIGAGLDPVRNDVMPGRMPIRPAGNQDAVRAGALDGLSIGFKAVKARRDSASGVRRLEKVDLWEISVVTFPMLPGARVESVKARPFAASAPTEREFERWLTRDAGLTRTEARAILRSGLPGLKALRDASLTFDDDDAMLASRLREAARLMSAT